MGGEKREKGEKGDDEMAKRSHGAKRESRVVESSKCIHSQDTDSQHHSSISASTSSSCRLSVTFISSHSNHISSLALVYRRTCILSNDRQTIDVIVMWLLLHTRNEQTWLQKACKHWERYSHPQGKELDRESGSFGWDWSRGRSSGHRDIRCLRVTSDEQICQVIDSLTGLDHRLRGQVVQSHQIQIVV